LTACARLSLLNGLDRVGMKRRGSSGVFFEKERPDMIATADKANATATKTKGMALRIGAS
jgi:hypothetical protein